MNEILNHNLKEIPVPADGACFFHSVMFHLHPELSSQSYSIVREATDKFRQTLSSSITLKTLHESNVYSSLFDQVFVETLERSAGVFEKGSPEYLIGSLLNVPRFKREMLPKCLVNRDRVRQKIVKELIRILELNQDETLDIIGMLREIDTFVGKMIETTDEVVIELMKDKLRSYTEWADHYMISYTSYYLRQGIIVYDETARLIMNSSIPYFDKPPIYLRNINNSHFELLLK
jgi:hypothetical protein